MTDPNQASDAEREAVNRLRGRTAVSPPPPPPPPPPPVAAEVPPVDAELPPPEPVAAAAEPAAPEPTATEQPVQARRPNRPLVALVALAVAAAAVLAVSTFLLASRHAKAADQRATATASADARGPIVAAAAQEMQAALSYDYRHLDQDFAAAEQGLTPSFRASYAHDTSTAVAANATKYHAVTKATVLSAGVITNTPTTATVLAFVDQTSTNSLLKAPRLDSSRVKVTLLKQHGRWLLNSLNTL